MRCLIVAQVARLKALVLRIEEEIAAVVAASPDPAARYALLRSAPGVGPVVAACLMARMPEPGRIASRQITALAALTLARAGKGHLAATSSRLRAAGKPFKLAIVATMRKLLITLNAMVKNNTAYRSA